MMDPFQKLLVYTGTEHNQNAISRAVALAMENHASVTLMEVIKPIPRALGLMSDVADPHEMESLLAEDHARKLREIADEYAATGVKIEILVKIGDPATEIIHEVLRQNHDLLIKTADGLSLSGRLFGSIARTLLRYCPCPVLLLKPAIHGEFDNVLAAVDVDASDEVHSALNDKILKLSSAISKSDDAALHLAVAWDYAMEGPLRRRTGDAEVDAALKQHELNVQNAVDSLLQRTNVSESDAVIHIKRGPSAAVIQHTVDEVEADLLVMGTVCRTGVTGLLVGNTAESIIADVHCSVLALKPEGFVCPISLPNEQEHTAQC